MTRLHDPFPPPPPSLEMFVPFRVLASTLAVGMRRCGTEPWTSDNTQSAVDFGRRRQHSTAIAQCIGGFRSLPHDERHEHHIKLAKGSKHWLRLLPNTFVGGQRRTVLFGRSGDAYFGALPRGGPRRDVGRFNQERQSLIQGPVEVTPELRIGTSVRLQDSCQCSNCSRELRHSIGCQIVLTQRQRFLCSFIVCFVNQSFGRSGGRISLFSAQELCQR